MKNFYYVRFIKNGVLIEKSYSTLYAAMRGAQRAIAKGAHVKKIYGTDIDFVW